MKMPDVLDFRKMVLESRNDLKELALDLWNHPETAWKETYSSKALVSFLQNHGADVTPEWLFPTAFKSEAGQGGRCFAIAAEFDALPGIGHGCGHNLIATAGVAAYLAVARMLRETGIPGRVLLLGTPAEESGGGKVLMLEKGCLDGVDACMMVHPSWRTTTDSGSTAIRRYDISFTGSAAHAAAAPELGVNALDAVMLLFAAVNAYRQQMPDCCRIHGIVMDGGDMPNIIPASASCRFYLRSHEEAWLDKLNARFLDMVQGAALMTGAKPEVQSYHAPYRSRKPCEAMNARYLRDMESSGYPCIRPARKGAGSSDFGDFSHYCPGIHPYFGISDREIPCHSLEFAEAAKTEKGLDSALAAASSMAEIAFAFLADDSIAAEVQAGFVRD